MSQYKRRNFINCPDLYKDDSFDIIVLKDMYSFSDIITGGLIGSILALGIRYLLERWSASTAYKRELRKQVFQRKTDAVERAMSWYQEAFDMYSLYQIAISEYDGSLNPVTLTKLQYVSVQMIKLLQETSVKLNPIYLYYDFTDINLKYRVAESSQITNKAFILAGQIQQHLVSDKVIDADEQKAREQWFWGLKQTLDIAASAMENQKAAIVESQQRLRNEYKKYMN